MGVKSFDHVGVVVDDLEAATTFFLDLGLDREGAGSVEGELVEKVVGLDDVRIRRRRVCTLLVGRSVELDEFELAAAIRHDRQGTVGQGHGHDRRGRELRGHLPALLRPRSEGIIVELAERIGSQGPSTEP